MIIKITNKKLKKVLYKVIMRIKINNTKTHKILKPIK